MGKENRLLLRVSPSDDLICRTCEVFEECEPPPVYSNRQVKFFNSHKDFKILPNVFEFVTEQALVRPAHKQGAIFEEATEQYLKKVAVLRYRIEEIPSAELRPLSTLSGN